jgi:hypothetical protein
MGKQLEFTEKEQEMVVTLTKQLGVILLGKMDQACRLLRLTGKIDVEGDRVITFEIKAESLKKSKL